jgi:tetratricopeptide (TPR) repeat protein
VSPENLLKAQSLALKVESLTRMTRGSVYLQTGQAKRAAKEQEAAIELLGEVLRTQSDDLDLRFLAAIGNANLGAAALEARDEEKAALHLGRARQLIEELLRARPGEPKYAGVHALILNLLGALHGRANKPDRAEELFAAAIEIGRSLVALFPGDVDYRHALARALSNRGNVLRSRGYLRRAAEPLAEARAILETLVRDHDDIGSLHVELSWNYYHTALLHQSRDDFRAADEWLTKALGRLAAKPAPLRADVQARDIAGAVHETRGTVRERLKLFQEAADDFAKASEYAAEGERTRLRIERARLLASAGQVEKAVEELEAAVAMSAELSGSDHFAAGVVFARAAKEAGKPDRGNELARLAVRELTAAAESSYFRDRSRRSLLDEHPDLKHLRNLADFNALRDRVRH